MYIKKSIGDIGESYGIPIWISISMLILLLKANWIFLSTRKESIQLYNDFGRPKLIYILINWLADIWLKAPLMFINKVDVTFLSYLANWMLWIKVIIASIADFFRLPLIWLKCSRSVVSAK